MFSHEYLALGLICMSLLAGYQYLEWKLTFQCSSSTWVVCFSCLFKNSNVLYRSAMSSCDLSSTASSIYLYTHFHTFSSCFSSSFLPAEDFSSQENIDVPEAGGWDAMLSSEDEDEFFDLQIVKHYDGEVRIWPTQGSQRLPSWFYRIVLKMIFLPGESRSFLGLHSSWMSTAESRCCPRSESILDYPHCGAAQPPCRDAASPAQTHLCEPHWTTGAG